MERWGWQPRKVARYDRWYSFRRGDCIVADSYPGVPFELGVKKVISLPFSVTYTDLSEFDVHCTGPSFHTFTFDLDTGEWRQRFPPTSPPGACCVDGANAFDVAGRR